MSATGLIRGMTGHTLHVTEWDTWQATLQLQCHGGPGDACHTIIDEDQDDPIPIEHCNAVEWFENVGDDLITGRLPGEPPWRVEIEWTDDGPHIIQPVDKAHTP